MSVYDTVTKRILEELEQGTVPWVKPWRTTLPYNTVSQKAYSGVNILLLWQAPYMQSAWLTFQQAQGLGGHVKKGEKATPIVYASTHRKKSVGESRENKKEKIPFLKWYSVFNIEQCEGLPEWMYRRLRTDTEYLYAEVETFLENIGAKVLHGGHRVCFIPSLDLICLPNPPAFRSLEHYWATSLHEHSHWSGHASRLNQDLSGRFGESAYAAEELVAELCAAFLCAALEIPGQLRHADYIGRWLKLLGNDKRAIFTAARKATEAADHLRSFTQGEGSHE